MPRRASVNKDQVQSHPVLAGGHVILMSAENPAFPQAATFQGADAMQQALESQGLEYEPTRGKYGKPESSFIVHVNDPSHIEAALGLAKRFGQESAVYSTGGKHQLVWVNGPHEGQATAPSEGQDFYEAEPEDNYTMIPGPNGEPHGFVAMHLNLNDPPQPFSAGTPPTPVPPAEAAKAVVKAAVEVYHDILLGLRMRELAKAEEKAAARGPQVPMEKTMKLTDLIKSQVAKAPKANGGAITVGKKEQSEESTKPEPRDAKDDEGLNDPMSTEKAEEKDNGKNGYHVETYGGGKHTSVAWYADKAQADKHAKQLHDSGRWSGMPPKVTPGRQIHKSEFPTSNKFAIALGTPKKSEGSPAAAGAKATFTQRATTPSSPDAFKSEVHVNKGNLKANGGRIARHSIWKKAEVATAPEANGGDIQVGKCEIPAGNKKANGGKITLGKQEWVIDLKATGHDEKRVIEKDPVKGSKGFEEPKVIDGANEKERGTSSTPEKNAPKKGPKQGPAGPEILKPEASPGGPQDLGDGGAVKGKGDAKGGGTDIFDSVKGKRNPAKDPVIEKAEFGEDSSHDRSHDESAEDEARECPACGGHAPLSGHLGNRAHHNCQDCGMWFSHGSTEKAESMKAPKAPGAAAGGAPKLGGAGGGGSSPPKMGLPKAAPGAKPPAMHAMSEKTDISGVPSAPSAGPAGNTAITSVDMPSATWHGKSEASGLILTSLKKALGEPEQRFGRAPAPAAGAKSPLAAGKMSAASVAGTPEFKVRQPGQSPLAGMKPPPAAVSATAGVSKPMGVPAAQDKASMAGSGPLSAAKVSVTPKAPSTAGVKPFDAGALNAANRAQKTEVASGNLKANGGKVTVAKEEPKDHSERLAVWRGNREKERSAAGKPSVEHTLFEESDPKVLHPSDKKVKKAELCKGCGKMHKTGPCA